MPTVIHELADAFLRRKQALAERGQAKTKLAGSDYFMPKSAKEDLNNRLSVFEQGGLPELLKQGASEMYHNPIVNTAISLTPGAGDVQSGYEAVQSAKEGKWGEAGLNALGVLPFIPSMGMIGKTVWHGSPHTFDKFDLSKIGTGEGAQAYGHGLYFAEHPEVAMGYQPRDLGFEDKIMQKYQQAEKSGDYAAMQVYEDFLTHKSPAEVAQMVNEAGFKGKDAVNAQKALEHASKQYHSQTAGALYKVDLPDEQIAKMLDWDKPLSEQSAEIQNAVAPLIAAAKKSYPNMSTDLTGRHLYQLYSAHRGANASSNQKASQALFEAGIPGLQYLDQASRGAGEGTRNYVVFSDEIPKILERNGTSVFEFPKD